MEVQILTTLAGDVLKKLAAQTGELIELGSKVQSECVRLEEKVSAIKALLSKVERLNNPDDQLRDWLGKLTDVLYDADNVLDEFRYRCLQRQVENHGMVRRPSFRSEIKRIWEKAEEMASSFIFSGRMDGKIKSIMEKLDGIAADKSSLWLPEAGVGVVDMGIVGKEESHSFVDPSGVFGREQDKRVIIQHLRLWTKNLSVIPIVGFEGIGKTTVAQLVYNDPWVAENFKLKLWVCVSNDFHVKMVMKKIIHSAKKRNCGDMSMDASQIRLRNALNNERFLLILDDVWSIHRHQWVQLQEFLGAGEVGSKIIVTTQSRSVAAVMGTVPTYQLGCLSNEDSVSLFTRLAFNDDRRIPSHVQSMATEIVERCGGVPELLVSTASDLFASHDHRKWSSTRDTAHKLRLQGLPSAMRQCLALCSIFPANFRFYNFRLIDLWIAQDFVTSSHPIEDLEDAGYRYMDVFHSRCLFQNLEPDFGDFFHVQIHDLVHHRARESAQPEYRVLNFHPNADPPSLTKTRHVSLSEDQWPVGEADLGVLKTLGRKNKVRTILCPFERAREIDESLVKTFVKRFRYMRVLDLSYSCFSSLPESIGDLIHLRLLSLRSNDKIKSLPNSICKLYNLQTLVLLGCFELDELPRDIKNMISLRHLEITAKQSDFPDLGESKSLQFLGIVGCGNLTSLFREGQNFPVLGTLLIQGCGSLVSLLPSIKHLKALRTLKVADCEGLDLGDGDNAQFRGFQTLWFLVIVKLPMLVGLPHWILRTAASNCLQRIVIEACPNLAGLPQHVLQNPIIHQKFDIRN